MAITIVLLIPILFFNNQLINRRIASVARPDSILYVSVTETSESSYYPEYVKAMIKYHTKECIMMGVYIGLAIAFVLLISLCLDCKRVRRKFVEAMLPERERKDAEV